MVAIEKGFSPVPRGGGIVMGLRATARGERNVTPLRIEGAGEVTGEGGVALV